MNMLKKIETRIKYLILVRRFTGKRAYRLLVLYHLEGVTLIDEFFKKAEVPFRLQILTL